MSWFNTLARWIVVSSADPGEISLTIKGVLVGLVPYVIALAGLGHLNFGADQLNTAIDAVATFVQAGLALVSAAMVLVGMARKVWITIKVHQQTTGTAQQ
jgi:uncharacterized membrane protein (GlpM family)